MPATIVEGALPYTGGTGIEIDGNKVISLLLREENNLILVNDENEVYTDLQLQSGLTPQSDFPVGVTTGKILQSDGWEKSGLILNRKTTSGDYARWIYATDGEIYFDNGTGTWKQVYYSDEVDALFTQLRNELATVAFTGDYDDLIDKPVIISATAPANPVEGMMWYDTTTHQLKVFGGRYWDNVGGGNTKSFYISGTGDSQTVLDEAQEAYDWYDAGKNPIIVYDGEDYILNQVDATYINFRKVSLATQSSTTQTRLQQRYIQFTLSSGVVTNVTNNYADVVPFLATNVNYSSSFTPTVDGHPATKKYADDKVSDTAYAASWNGVTGIAPSKNAVYDKINSIDGLIPSAATTSNQLADKNYVDDSINSVSAYYITKNAQGDAFATKAELTSATTFYSGGTTRTPTRNDYCIVLADETHSGECTRYSYQGTQWEYQYTVNESPMSQAQLDAINSGITAAKVTTYDGYASTIAGKQDALATQTAYTSKGTSTKVPTITTNTLGQVTGITETSIAFPVTSVNGNTGAVTVNAFSPSNSGSAGQVLTKGSGNTYNWEDGVHVFYSDMTTGEDWTDFLGFVNEEGPIFVVNETSSEVYTAERVANNTGQGTTTVYLKQGGIDYEVTINNSSKLTTAINKKTQYTKKFQINLSTATASTNITDLVEYLLAGGNACVWDSAEEVTWYVAECEITGGNNWLAFFAVGDSIRHIEFNITQTNGTWYAGTPTVDYTGHPFSPSNAGSTGQVLTKTANGYNWADAGGNTKAFPLSGTSGATALAEAQAIYDWYLAGKNPIIIYDNISYILSGTYADSIYFRSTYNGHHDQASYSTETTKTIFFDTSSNTVTTIHAADNMRGGNYLRTGEDYPTPYTPEYDGSPATKKYVDDNIQQKRQFYVFDYDNITSSDVEAIWGILADNEKGIAFVTESIGALVSSVPTMIYITSWNYSSPELYLYGFSFDDGDGPEVTTYTFIIDSTDYSITYDESLAYSLVGRTADSGKVLTGTGSGFGWEEPTFKVYNVDDVYNPSIGAGTLSNIVNKLKTEGKTAILYDAPNEYMYYPTELSIGNLSGSIYWTSIHDSSVTIVHRPVSRASVTSNRTLGTVTESNKYLSPNPIQVVSSLPVSPTAGTVYIVTP